MITFYKKTNIKKINIMKKILFLLAVLPMVLLSACSDDEDDVKNVLVGTVWECTKNSDLYTFDFNSEASCKLTKKEKQLDSNFDWINVTSYVYYSYTIDGNKVALTPDDNILVPLVGTINCNSMSIINNIYR